ncbi:MAG: PAS domain S-box protein [Geobacter sp.]|nr:PAS domain S-box protein [Geobacter sp.]
METAHRGMNGTGEVRLKGCVLGVLFGLLGFAANGFNLELYHGIDFLFGSIFVMLAVGWFGMVPGLIAGMISASFTVMHWHHPWALVVFSCEALTVGWLHQRRGKDLVIADTLFWFVAGIPLSWLLYRSMLQMSLEQVAFIVSKQAVNGIFNALLAAVILAFFRVRSTLKGTATGTATYLRSFLFIVILSLLLIPALCFMAIDTRYDISAKETETLLRMNHYAETVRDMVDERIAEQRKGVREGGTVTSQVAAAMGLGFLDSKLSSYAAKRGVLITVVDGRANVVLSTAGGRTRGERYDPKKDREIALLPHGVNLVTPRAMLGESAFARFQKSIYLKEAPLENGTDWSILIEAPLAPLFVAIRNEVISRFLMMLLLVIFAGAISQVLSRALSRPLMDVAELTTALPQKIIAHEVLTWPRVAFHELEVLLGNISQMAESLRSYLAGLEEAKATLESRVAERTHDLEESERTYREFAEFLPQTVFETDREGRLTFVNRHALELFGFSEEELYQGLWTFDMLASGDRERAREIFRFILGGNSGMETGREYLARRKDGSTFPVIVYASPVTHEGEVTGVRGMLIDISERYKAEDEVRRLNEELELIVSERSAALDYTNRELEGFCYAISHELRAPIARLQGFCEVLKDECTDEADGFKLFYAERINIAGQQLRQVIDAILLLSRLSRTEIVREEIDISALAEDIMHNIMLSEPGRKVQFLIEPGLTAQGDEQLLAICLGNLLGNAMKYSSRKELSVIEFGRTSDDGVTAFFVRDNGAGFDMAYADKLFKPFSRLHGPDEFLGTGIGLATVQRIVERHNGRIWAVGTPDEGATFYFTLG